MSDLALSDIKVLDLTHYIAGPYCAKLLADYGAEVIKIEKPRVGDGARRLGPFLHDVPDPETSGLFLHLNINKKGITLNLKTEVGRRIFKELVPWADIVVENFSPKVMPGLGLSYEVLEEINPRLVMTSISNFGQTGPYRDYKATEIVAFGMGGPMYSSGDPEREPLKYAGNVGLYLAGAAGALATMVGLFAAAFHNFGQHIDISVFESLVASPGRLLGLGRASFSGEFTPRQGGAAAIRFCKDGYVSIYGGLAAGMVEHWWPRVVKMLKMPELLEDPRFSTVEARAQNHGEFDAIFLPWLIDRTKQEVFHAAQRERVPCAPVYTINELFEDPQYRARGFFVEVEHPVAGKNPYPGAPFIMSETPWQVRSPAPTLGQHNEEVFSVMMGYSKADLVRLRQLEVI